MRIVARDPPSCCFYAYRDHVVREVSKVGKYTSLLFVSLIILAGCAGNRGAVQDSGDYVEIDNPGVTMTLGAPPTTWVPRSYLEKGIPRGSEVIERGVSSLRGSSAGSEAQQPAPQTATVQPVQPPPVRQPQPVVSQMLPVAPVRQAATLAAGFAMEVGQNTLTILKALRTLAEETREVAALVPWYGRVVSVDGERIYINAGKESGLCIGVVLNLYRNCKVIDKQGYSPGQKVAIFEIRGFVGTDGAFATVKEVGKTQVSDLVGFE